MTVTVLDSGLNGNLASGPFGFLIEYPWSNRYTYMQLRSPEVTRVNLHLSVLLSLPQSVFFFLNMEAFRYTTLVLMSVLMSFLLCLAVQGTGGTGHLGSTFSCDQLAIF